LRRGALGKRSSGSGVVRLAVLSLAVSDPKQFYFYKNVGTQLSSDLTFELSKTWRNFKETFSEVFYVENFLNCVQHEYLA